MMPEIKIKDAIRYLDIAIAELYGVESSLENVHIHHYIDERDVGYGFQIGMGSLAIVRDILCGNQSYSYDDEPYYNIHIPDEVYDREAELYYGENDDA